MEMIHEDNWEVDINFSDTKVFQRKGVYAMESDKELSLACERYQFRTHSPQEYLEDDESETSSSILSTSNYSEVTSHNTLIRGLDGFMYAGQGTIQRLGNSKQVHAYDDWDQDIEITPSKFKQQPKKNLYDFQMPIEPPSLELPSPNANVYFCEPEYDNDNDFDGLEFPQDMTLLSKKLDEKKKGIEVYNNPVQQQQTMEKQKPNHILASIQREKEEDDFCEGLNIKEFNIEKQKKSINTKQQRSRLPQPKPIRTQQQQQQPKPPMQRLYRFTLDTVASRRRAEEIRAQSQKSLKPDNKQKSDNKSSSLEKKGANGMTLISKPKKEKLYGHCSQLDELDNLNTLKGKKKYVLSTKHTKGENKTDSQRPWRTNMAKAHKKSTVKLIKPNNLNIKKEFNGMKFDENSQSWKGNENALLAFQEKTSIRRPLLINSRQPISKYTSAIVNNMIYDAENFRWVSIFGPEAEHNELDAIEDLKDNTVCKKDYREFKLTVEVKREMMLEQERYESWIQHWPL
ncbi:hypothetical protein G6F46_006338 [Rhizopus delemar]|uniref:Uncharacterized protein n=2 Tax=Rhizopus TaxID=4842 RepID=A0A9P6Z3M6_9FUNG|nr:hypothetical protein G6F55_004940 [Rhizopus delemar]KAG1550049.1 hypothetical protein G6F51_002679 [Rhizopus arrhizus]KAG1502845.1 hypothetical protein G6F54_002086 [Rhizopus delemar]KAG1511371.1 hypothetical protein G6F53_005987 [Rhizopus delemar]KAG1526633.1 hypothetical protein G6F52_002253 [Rhizopus delemar]